MSRFCTQLLSFKESDKQRTQLPMYDDTTLTAIAIPSAQEVREVELRLTIVFHPVAERIGENACFEPANEAEPVVLGRHSPNFARRGDPGAALDDPYVSRNALTGCFIGDTFVLRRSKSASRCRVGRAELSEECRLTTAQLNGGVAIFLAGRVVLLLRRTLPYEPLLEECHAGQAMTGSSAYMDGVRAQISTLASTDLDVLIRGETGTGKELVAQAVHAGSNRAGVKMITVNMAAIPAALAPAALFGSARGAFTGASKDSAGYFERAQGGVLFLDEIGETPDEVQAQLLRVLQQREIQVVGGSIRTVSLRIISATDASLDEPSCSFKAALRHRLAQSEVVLLPLREHPEDIGELLWQFIRKSLIGQKRGHLLPENCAELSGIAAWAELFHRFLMYTWPGNIRQLENYSLQVGLASTSSLTIPEVIRQQLYQLPEAADKLEDNPAEKSETPKFPNCSGEDFLTGYEQARFEVARAARRLGISRQAVYRHISESPGLCLARELPMEKISLAMERSRGNLTEAATELKVSRTALRERIRSSPVRRAP